MLSKCEHDAILNVYSCHIDLKAVLLRCVCLVNRDLDLRMLSTYIYYFERVVKSEHDLGNYIKSCSFY